MTKATFTQVEHNELVGAVKDVLLFNKNIWENNIYTHGDFSAKINKIVDEFGDNAELMQSVLDLDADQLNEEIVRSGRDKAEKRELQYALAIHDGTYMYGSTGVILSVRDELKRRTQLVCAVANG